MKKIIQVTLLFGTVLLVVFSCDLIEEDPFTDIEGSEFFNTEADALAGLSAAYAQLKTGNGYYRQQWLSNLIAASDQGLSSFNHGAFRTGTISNSDPNLPVTWTNIYSAIKDANNVIVNTPNIDMDEELRDRILGEARFLRALHYFNLVRAFGPVPLRLEPIQFGEEAGLPVSSVLNIYNQIFIDLGFAVKDCWGKLEVRNGYVNDLGRATDVAAHALLTKAYLHIASAKRTALEGDLGNAPYLEFPLEPSRYYALAVTNADEVLASPDYRLAANEFEWASIFDADNGNNDEMIFEIQGSSLTEQGTALANLFSPRESGLAGGGFGGTNRMIPNFINNYIETSDPRFTETIISEFQNSTTDHILNDAQTGYFRTDISTGEAINTLFVVYTGKYIDRSATSEYTSQQNWHVVRLADVYLMRAEALAELAQNPAIANENINALRMRAGVASLYDGAGKTMDDFRTDILRERATELHMEGHRFFDLTRMGVYNEYCITVHNATRGVRGPEDYTWPIPIIESSANASID